MLPGDRQWDLILGEDADDLGEIWLCNHQHGTLSARGIGTYGVIRNSVNLEFERD